MSDFTGTGVIVGTPHYLAPEVVAGEEADDESLGGAERYKVDLSDERDPLYQAIGMATSPVGKAAAALHTHGIETRNRLRESKTLRNFYFEGLAPARVLLGRLRNRGMQ